MKNIITLIITIFGFSLINTTQAQISINTCGGTAIGSNGSITYSIGQVFYNTNTGNNNTETQGVQQPY